MSTHRTVNTSRTNQTGAPVSADDRVAALMARRAAANAQPAARRKHPAHGARIVSTVAAASAVLGLTGVMAMANTSTATVATGVSATATVSNASTATASALRSTSAATAATPTTQASTSTHGS